MTARKIWVGILVGLVALAVAMAILEYFSVKSWPLVKDVLPLVETAALVVTACIIWHYTRETAELRKAAKEQVTVAQQQIEEVRQANEFDAYVRIYQPLQEFESAWAREELTFGFDRVLGRIAHRLWGENATTKPRDSERAVNIEWVLKNVNTNPGELGEFEAELCKLEQVDRPGTDHELSIDFSEVVEKVLADFETIAAPLFACNRAVHLAAEIYREAVGRSAPLLAPYIAIQMRLRGDPDYRKHFRFLLQHLRLPSYGLPPVIRQPE